jgi:hypothetical protein
MSDDRPKSAYEIAMEKLRRQDRLGGEAAAAPLTPRQKKAIAEARNRAEAQLAEIEILFGPKRQAAAEDPEALKKAEEEYARDRRRVEERRDAEIARIRAGKKAAGG